MSVFADGYSSYLNYAFNYNNKLEFLSNIFKSGYETCRDTNFITEKFLRNLDDFPKFPYFFNIVSGENYIKIIEIYNVSLDIVDNLYDVLLLRPEIARLKSSYDLIPERIEDIIREAYYQYAYLSSLDNIYPPNFYRSYMYERSYRNFYSNLYSDNFRSMGEIESAGIENSSFLPLYVIREFLFNTMFNNCNLLQKLLEYSLYFNIYGPASEMVDITNLNSGMTSFITSYKSTMSTEMTNLITKSVYNFITVSPTLSSQISSVIQSRLNTLPTIFNSFLSTLYNDIVFNFVGRIVDSLYSVISSNILSKIYNDGSIINQVKLSSLSETENNLFNSFLRINSVDVEPYLFVSYFYKFWPSKFVNILCLCLQNFVENVIKPSTIDILSLSEFRNIIDDFYCSAPEPDPDHADEYIFRGSYIDYNTLRSYLVNTLTLTPSNYLLTISNYYQVPRFGCTLVYIDLLDKFFATDAYKNFVSDLLEDVFVFLRDNGHIDYSLNWYDKHKAINIYLKTFMRYKILDNTTGTRLFQNVTDNFTTIFNRIIQNTTHTYTPYPAAGTYDISISILSAFELNTLFSSMTTGVTLDRTHQFAENLFLSVLTRETIYGAFEYFIT